ncbi:endonuclease/exonuclease/phosphatase family protein [Phyllobacterium myrsinacearum]|uniref:Endonuclease/exonuclease/phosphatase (EEP) superfamily protein YafD n=1 Tax=Phyllobacterium myrsinacearum TaxID=28101 RepID=A0A839E9X4_9HYPH|nr:endonuclease/exonuclease/phosphatase family protein [Phyllobacterium myrsinacearum]MBA8876663.1 endonuclease/exonuclease/phosphatase (EEP) superfamily protein YafD [Phyllobacterium myrsinacearum]
MTTTTKSSWAKLAAVLVPVLLSVPLVLGFFGSVHPVFDAFAHFRMHLAALMIITALPALFMGLWREGLMTIVLAVMALSTVLAPSSTPASAGTAQSSTPSGQPEYKLLQLNLRFDNAEQTDVIRLIAQQSPDVITLQEVSESWRSKLAAIEARYPYNLYCPSTKRIGGVAILSRRPFALGTTPQCIGNALAGLARIDFGGRSALIAALHLEWPWPFRQAENVDELRPFFERLQGPMILAGDFNAAPWSRTVRQIGEASKTRPVDGLRPSWLVNGTLAKAARWIGLPLDHLLISDRVTGARVETLTPVGSDHLPLLLRFAINGADEDGPDLQTVMLTD